MLIGELSQRTGASRRSLRHYEAKGLLRAARQPNGYRDYPTDSALIVAKIKALLGAGLSLDIVRDILPCTVDASPRVEPCARLVATLRAEITRLDADIACATESRATIEAILDRSS